MRNRKDPEICTDRDFILWGFEAVVSRGSGNKTIEAETECFACWYMSVGNQIGIWKVKIMRPCYRQIYYTLDKFESCNASTANLQSPAFFGA